MATKKKAQTAIKTVEDVELALAAEHERREALLKAHDELHEQLKASAFEELSVVKRIKQAIRDNELDQQLADERIKIFEAERERLTDTDKAAAAEKRLRRANALHAALAELYRTEYMRAAEVLSRLFSLHRYAEAELQSAVRDGRELQLNFVSTPAQSILGNPWNTKPFFADAALPNPLNHRLRLWNPDGQHNPSFDVGSAIEALLAAGGEVRAAFAQILKENPLPPEMAKQPHVKTLDEIAAEDEARLQSYGNRGRGSVTAYDQDGNVIEGPGPRVTYHPTTYNFADELSRAADNWGREAAE